MKLFDKIIGCCASVLMASLLSGCAAEEDYVKPSALRAEASVTVPAKGEEPVTFTVYSDDDWMVDTEDWFTVTPASGSKTMDIQIVAEDNVIDGVMQKPRQGTLTIANKRGYTITSTVYQKGDTYFGDPELTVTKALELADGETAKIPESQVVALTLTGMVISDGTSNMLVDGIGQDVKIGDKIYINGKASVTSGKFPEFVLDECEILSSGDPVYPTAKDISSSMSSYEPKSMEFVKVSGSVVGLSTNGILAGAAVRVPGTSVRMMVAEVPASLGFAEYNYHKVEMSGYCTGKVGTNLRFIPAVVKDGGLDESVVPETKEPGTVLFEDNFDWMQPYIDEAEAAGTAVGSSVEENNAGGSAPNLYTTASLASLGAELQRRGYKDVNAACESIYPQKYYWKFCKTSNHTGLQLPAIDYYGELQLGFDWSPQMTGSGNIDKVTLVVAVTTGESTVIAGEFSYKDWSKGKLAWHAAKATINITPESIIQIRPDKLEDHDGITQQRFYLDNIVVKVPAPDVEPVYANIEVNPDDIMTFEGTGGESKITVTSDVDFTLSPSEKWITLSSYEGKKNEPAEITVTCAASDLSVMREAKLVINSGDSQKSLRIIQSAAGQELDPFISLKDGNSVEVIGQGAEFSATIQSNTTFETKIDDDWITAVPTTSAKVEWTTLKFKAASNLTGAPRTGTIRFCNGNIETVLTVKQEKFEPSIKVTFPGVWTIAGIGETRKVTVESNVPFKVTAPSWIKFPATEVPAAGTYPINVTFEANSGSDRTGEVVFTNDEYSYTVKIQIAQAASNVVFFDDFAWMQPIIDIWTAKGGKIGDTIGNKKDDNAQGFHKELKDFAPAYLSLAGYEDLLPSAQLLYAQDKYLKFNRTGGNNTAIRLPSLAVTSATDVTMEFDHAAMVQGSGTVDDSKVVIVIEGDGEFENGTKCSEILAIDQPKGTYQWTHSSVKIKGVTSKTRLVAVMYRVVLKKDADGNYTQFVGTDTSKWIWDVSGAGRIFIDNIKITK